MPFAPSPYQQTFFDWIETGTGSAVVEAVAGAGKTTTALEGFARMRGRVVYVVFNNKNAKEARQKIADRGITHVDAKTFHSVGMGALLRAFPQLKGRDPDEKKVLRICEALVEESGRRELVGLEPAVAKIVSMAKQRGIGVRGICDLGDQAAWEEMVDHFALDDALPEGQEHMVAQVTKMAQICLRRSIEDTESFDYDDMIYVPLHRDLRVWAYDWVVVDEAQDTNPTRRMLARKLMYGRGARLVAIGDSHQAIYGFTGTDNDSLEQIARDFRCTRLPLTITYRCPKTVVEVAHQFVSHIQAADSAPEGRVVRYRYEDLMQHIQLGDAVLCRFNKYLVTLVFKLIRQGVAAKIEGRAIGQGLAKLAGRWKSIRTLTALETKLVDHREREVAKARAKDDERRIEEINDRHETMMVLIERAREQKIADVAGLQTMILSLFADDIGEGRAMVTLCSVHRSKGLEWDRVHILGLQEVMPARCSREWQMDQEVNLQYVATTRAKDTLHLVSGIREG